MPRFTGQNKKKIDPRYFLKEGMLSQMMGDSGVQVGDELVVSGYEVEVTDVIRPGQSIEVALLDTRDGLDTATAVWNGSEWELARS
tara:strand:+ start:4871 stop:5128 length:258 start_codon:yes stop_codon:yes gene_type:complete